MVEREAAAGRLTTVFLVRRRDCATTTIIEPPLALGSIQIGILMPDPTIANSRLNASSFLLSRPFSPLPILSTHLQPFTASGSNRGIRTGEFYARVPHQNSQHPPSPKNPNQKNQKTPERKISQAVDLLPDS